MRLLPSLAPFWVLHPQSMRGHPLSRSRANLCSCSLLAMQLLCLQLSGTLEPLKKLLLRDMSFLWAASLVRVAI